MKNYEEIIKSKLSERRYKHCVNVANTAKRLALVYDENPEKAYTAGILHDITKELSNDEQISLMRKHNMQLDEVEKLSPKVWHQKTAALFVRYNLAIDDKNILNAIAYHTTGRANMTKLEKIVYIADLISEDRTYKDVDKFRQLAMISLDNTMIECLKYSITSLSKNNRLIDKNTFLAYNYFLVQNMNKKQEDNV